MEMDTVETVNLIRGPLLTINEKFDQSTKSLNDFMAEALQWCDNIKKVLEKESVKKQFVQESDIQLPKVFKVPQPKKQIKKNSVSASSTITGRETYSNIVEDTVATRTRGALKANRESKTTVNLNLSVKNETRTRGRNTKNTITASVATSLKRSAEDEMQEKDRFKKKKQISGKNRETLESDSEVFKKPKTRGRGKATKTKETESIKSLDNSTLEESKFFNSPIFLTSSPKVDPAPTGTATVVFSPNQLSSGIRKSSPRVRDQCLSQKSLNKNIADPSSLSTSNDSVEIVEGNTKPGEKLIELPSSKNSTKIEKMSKGKNSTLLTEDNEKLVCSKKEISSLPTSPKSTAPSSDLLVENQEAQGSKLVDVTKSIAAQNRNSLDKNSISRKTEKIDSPPSKMALVLENLEGENQVLNCNIQENSAKPSCVTRSKSSRLKANQEKNSADLKLSPEKMPYDSSSAAEGNLNITKAIPAASKRTKPVLKSKIFDNQGNICPGGQENDSVIKAEKTYTLRSSPREQLLEPVTVQKRVEPPLVNEKVSIEKQKSPNERSKRTRGKNLVNEQVVIDIAGDTGRITRTKSKKAKEAQENAARKSGLTLLARKSLNKAKIISLQKEKIKAVQVLSSRLTYQKVQKQNVLSKLYSHSKNHGPLQTAPCLKSSENLLNSGKGKYLLLHNERANAFITPAKRGGTGDLLTKSAAKTAKENDIDKELKLKALKEKGEEAIVKKEMAIKNRQKELKEKNVMKLQSAMKQRQKLEMEKYNNIVQSEKEKEAKHKLILQERELKIKEKAMKMKMMTEQKLAVTEERRRLEEEARIAKLKEQEAEHQRMLMDKEKEIERHQKWAQERMADEQAREKYEMKIKEQQMGSKLNASKKPETTFNVWNYKSRNENDFGLEDEFSEQDSNDEEPVSSNRPIPKWAKRVLAKKCLTTDFITQEMMAEYMTCHSKTPDIHKMFKMTPKKKIKRTSSAIWNTPSS